MPFGIDAAGGLGSALLELADPLLGILGMDNFRTIFYQDEGGENGVRQYIDEPTDRGLWKGTVDKSRPDYYFILKGPQNMKVFGFDVGLGGVQRSIQIPFKLSPQRESISEPVASTISYAQGGGKIRESEGMISKDITISGVCGLYPNPAANRNSGIGSGLEQLKYLETCFRRYAFMCRYADISKQIQLIYVSRRRQEAWVVEPRNITTEDAVEHNFSFHYTITLEALYPYSGDDAKGMAQQLLSNIPGWNNISQALQCMGEAVDQCYAFASTITAVYSGFINTLLGPMVRIANAYADYKSGRIPTLLEWQKEGLKSVYRNLVALEDALVRSGERPSATSKAVSNARKNVGFILLDEKAFSQSPSDSAKKVATLQANQVLNFKDLRGNPISKKEAVDVSAAKSNPPASSVYTGKSVPAKVKGTANNAAAAEAGVLSLTTNPVSIGSSSQEDVPPIPGTYSINRTKSSTLNGDTVLPPGTADVNMQINWRGSYFAALAKVDPSNSDYRTAIIAVNDSIQTLATKLLGDAGRWVELVILNNLKYPYVASKDYVTDNSLTRVRAWGDTILYPVQKTTVGALSKRIWRNETSESLNLSPLERSLGCDVKIDKETRDIVFTSNDLALSYGIDNLDQFIRKRILLKKGILRRAISLGFSSIIGQKEVQEEMIRAEARGLFKDDDRIVSCQVIEMFFSTGILLLTLAVFVRDMQNPIIVKEQIAA